MSQAKNVYGCYTHGQNHARMTFHEFGLYLRKITGVFWGSASNMKSTNEVGFFTTAISLRRFALCLKVSTIEMYRVMANLVILVEFQGQCDIRPKKNNNSNN